MGIAGRATETITHAIAILIASATIFAVRSKRKWPAYLLTGLNPLLTTLFIILAATETYGAGAWALCSLTFAIEGVAAFMNVRSHSSQN